MERFVFTTVCLDHRMGMRSRNRNAEPLTGTHITRCLDTSDNSCTCSPDCRVHFMPTPATELHDNFIFDNLLNTACLCRNERLEVDDIEECCFYELGFYQSRFNTNDRLIPKYKFPFFHRINIACKTNVLQVIEE